MEIPIRKKTNIIHRFDSASSAHSSHLRIDQKTIAVKREDVAYTSPSTAENQNESEKVNANSPTKPVPIMEIISEVEILSSDETIIFFARWVIVQKRNNMVKALAKADKAFAIKATLDTSLPASKVNNLVRIIKIAQPGGCPISSLNPVAMNSPQSHKLAVGSRVHR